MTDTGTNLKRMMSDPGVNAALARMRRPTDAQAVNPVTALQRLVSVPREPIWRAVNMARGAYLKDLGNTPGHLNHWSKRGFVQLLSRYGNVVEARSPFPWTMLLVRL